MLHVNIGHAYGYIASFISEELPLYIQYKELIVLCVYTHTHIRTAKFH
jgi:hypothetical protein